LYYRVCSLIEIDGDQINLGFTQFQFDDWPLILKKQNCAETELLQVKELPKLSDPPDVWLSATRKLTGLSRERTGVSWGWTSGLPVKMGRSQVTESSLLNILLVLLNGPTSSAK
jgi:hypothetical protein